MSLCAAAVCWLWACETVTVTGKPRRLAVGRPVLLRRRRCARNRAGIAKQRYYLTSLNQTLPTSESLSVLVLIA